MAEKRRVCLEIGGSGRQVIVIDGDDWRIGDDSDIGPDVLVAMPGELANGRIVRAVNLGFYDADPEVVLGLSGQPQLLMNDAEAAALGEAVLAGSGTPVAITFAGIGTGIGGAVVDADANVTGNLFAHGGGFGDLPCSCGDNGCLETVAAGWALPEKPGEDVLDRAAAAIASAIGFHGGTRNDSEVVIAGGVARSHPYLVERIASYLSPRVVSPSRAPDGAKSAAAWGLAYRAKVMEQ